MKRNTFRFLAILISVFFIAAPLFADDDNLEKEIIAITAELKDLANHTGKAAKMTAKEISKETKKLQKKLDKLYKQWEAEHGESFDEYMAKAKKAGKKVWETTKKAGKKAAKKVNDFLDEE